HGDRDENTRMLAAALDPVVRAAAAGALARLYPGTGEIGSEPAAAEGIAPADSAAPLTIAGATRGA
ncbi:MAG: hypothetical protein ABI156_04120, partial [Caldimonas sp.]